MEDEAKFGLPARGEDYFRNGDNYSNAETVKHWREDAILRVVAAFAGNPSVHPTPDLLAVAYRKLLETVSSEHPDKTNLP